MRVDFSVGQTLSMLPRNKLVKEGRMSEIRKTRDHCKLLFRITLIV
jgi:hypothetical protein